MRLYHRLIAMIRSTCILILLFAVQSTWAMDQQWKQNSKKSIEQILSRHKISQDDISILFWGGETGREPVYALNESKRRIPASTTKLITAAAVLKAIPPGTKLKTQLLLDSSAPSAKYKGNLYLRGGGDPGFVSETMWFLVNAFVRTGVREIEGDIVVDDSLFDSQRYDASRQSQRVDRAYDSPVGAMSFNWNSVNVFVRPGAKVGDPARVYIDPENEYIQLDAQVSTVAGSARDAVRVDRVDVAGKNQDKIVVRGRIGVQASEVTVFKNITQPDYWSAQNLKSFLLQRGIKHTGKIRVGKVSSSAVVAAEAESKSIEHMLADMNKFSNNYVAEMLTKNLAVAKGDQGSMTSGMKYLHQYLKDLGHEKNQYVLDNPSGLTRDNQFSAKLLMDVLADMRGQFQYEPEFIASLPIAGIDGTLKNRMKRTKAERWVRAKTGYLSGVISLAGYLGMRQGSVVSFVIIYNGKADEWKVRQAIDEMLLAVMN